MESLLPSEIARLVFGYLEEQGCQKAAQALLEELPDLAECAKLRRKGKRIKKKVGDLTLVDMLQDYSAARDEIQEAFDRHQKVFSAVNKHDTLFEQIKALLNVRISGWQKNTQTQGMLCTSSEAQRVRTMKLMKFHKGKGVTRDSSIKEPPNLVLDVNTTQIGDLPGCSQSTNDLSYHIEDGDPVMPYMSEASNAEMSHLSMDSQHMAVMVDSGDLSSCAKDDKVTADREILTAQGMAHISQVTPQKRKGQVRRRSMSSPKSSSPFAEEDFEKILKSLYENTALHEKIAQNINRGLNCTKQFSGVENAETLSPHAIPQTQPMGREKEGSSDTFVHELDQMVNKIISETTADPVFENLVGDVFVSAAPMSSSQISPTSTRQSKPDMLHQFVCNLSSPPQEEKSDDACQRNAGDDTRNKSVIMVPVAGQNSEVRVEIMDGHLHKNGLTSPGKPVQNRSEGFTNQLNSNNEGSGPSSSRPRRSCTSKMYATKKKTVKKKHQTIAEKEAERKLGEDLIREFEEFQSKRPDRVSESETTLLADQGGLCSFIEHMDMPSLDISDPNEEVESTTKKDSVSETSETPKGEKQDYQGDKDGALGCSGSEVQASVSVTENITTQPAEQGLSQCGNQKPADIASSARGEQLLQSIESQGVQVDQSECGIGVMEHAAGGHGDTAAVLEAKMSGNSRESENVNIGPVVPLSTQQDNDNFMNGSSPLKKVDFNADIGLQPGTVPPKEVIQGEGRDPLSLSSPSHVPSVTVKTTTVPGISVAGCIDVIPDNLKGSASPYTLTELTPMSIQQQETFEQLQQAQTAPSFHSYQPSSYVVNTDGPSWTPCVQQGGGDSLEPQSKEGTGNTHTSASTVLSQVNTTTTEETQEQGSSTNIQDQQPADGTSSLTKVKSVYLTSMDKDGVLEEGQIINIPLADDVVPPKITVLQIKPAPFVQNMKKFVPILPKVAPDQQNKSSCAGTSNSMEMSVNSQSVFVLPNEVKVSFPDVTNKAAKVPKKVKKKVSKKKKADMNNDIVSRALSFALRSVTPKKVSPEGSGNAATEEVAGTEEVDLHAQDRAAVDVTSTAVSPEIGGGSFPQEPQQSKEVMEEQLNKTSRCLEQDKNEKGKASKRKETCSSDIQLSPVLKKLLSLSQNLSPKRLKDGASNYKSAVKASSPSRVHLPARKCRSTPSRKSGQARAVRALDFSTPCKNKTPSKSPSKASVSLRFSPKTRRNVSSPSKASVSLRFSPKTRRNVSSPSKASPQKKQDVVLKNTPSKTFSQNEITQHKTQIETVRNKTPLKETPRKKTPPKKTPGKKTPRKETPRKKTPKKVLPGFSEHKTPAKRTPPKRAVKKLNHSKKDAKEAHNGSEGSSGVSNISSLVPKDRSFSLGKARMSPARKKMINLRNTSLAMIPEEGECQTSSTHLSADEKTYCEDDEESLVLQMEDDSEVASLNCTSEHLEMSVCETSSNEDIVPFKKLDKSPEMELAQTTPVKLLDNSEYINVHRHSFDTPVVYSPSDHCGPGDDDLNTPMIPNMHQALETSKTPRLKDYPQGPYSNSSVATSYYHPSEHSITDSDGMTSPRLIMDDHSIDSSPVALAVQQLSDVSSDASPNKKISPNKKCAISNRVIGKVIEQELNKLFKSSTPQPVQKETKNQEGSQGKQTKKRRAPSVNYLNISESTCSEDEMEPTLSGSAKVKSKAKLSPSELNESRSRTRLRRRNMSLNENDNHTSKEEGKTTKGFRCQVDSKHLDKASKQDFEEVKDSVPSLEQDVEDGSFSGTTSPKNSIGDDRKSRNLKDLHAGTGSGKKKYISPKSSHSKKNFVDVFGTDISSSDGEDETPLKKVTNAENKMVKNSLENKIQNKVVTNVDEIESKESRFSVECCSEDSNSSPKENNKSVNAVHEEERLEGECSQSTVEADTDVIVAKTQRRSNRKTVQTKFTNIQHGVTTRSRSKSKDTSGVVLKEVSIEVVASSKDLVDHNEKDSAQEEELISTKLKQTQSIAETVDGAGKRKVKAIRSSTRQRGSQAKDKQQEDTSTKNIAGVEEKSSSENSSESSHVPAGDDKCKVNPSPFKLWGSDVRCPDKSYFSTGSMKSSDENLSDRWLECLGSKKSKCSEKELNKDMMHKHIPEGNEWWWKRIENDESLVMPEVDESLVVPHDDKKKKKKKKRKKDKSKKKKGCARLIDYKTSPLFKDGTPQHRIRDEEYGEMVNITPSSRRRRRYAEDGQKTPSATESPAKVCPRLKLSPAKSPYKGYFTTPQKSLFSPRKSIQRSIHFLNRKEQEHEWESRESPSENCATPVSETEELTNDPSGLDKDSALCSEEMNLSNKYDDSDEMKKKSFEKHDEAQCCEESSAALEGLNENGETFEDNCEPTDLRLPQKSARGEDTITGTNETGSTVLPDSLVGSESSCERRVVHSRQGSPRSVHSMWSEKGFDAKNVSPPNSDDSQIKIQEKKNEAIFDKKSKATSRSRGRYEVRSDDADASLPSKVDLAKNQSEGEITEGSSHMVLTHEVLEGNDGILESRRSINDKPDVLIIKGNEAASSVNHIYVNSGKVLKKNSEELKKLIPSKDSEALDKSDMRTSCENSGIASAEDIRDNLQKESITLHGVDAEGNVTQTTSHNSDIDEYFWKIDKQLAEMHGLMPSDQNKDIGTDYLRECMMTNVGDKESGGTNNVENQIDSVNKESIVTGCIEKESFVTGKNTEHDDTQDHSLLIRECEERAKKVKSDDSFSHSETKGNGNNIDMKESGCGNNKELKATAESDKSLTLSSEQCQNLVPSAQESSRPGYLGKDTRQNEGNDRSDEADLRREWKEESKEHNAKKKISVMSMKVIPLEGNSANGRQGEKEKSSSGSEISIEECPSPTDTDNLLTFTPLPNTPSKEVARICRDIMKEKCAMVAFPSESPLKKNVGTKSLVRERLTSPVNREKACVEPTALASRLVEVHQEPKDAECDERKKAYYEVRSDKTQESSIHPRVRRILDLDAPKDKADWAAKGQEVEEEEEEEEEEASEQKDSSPDLSSICNETGNTSTSLEVDERRRRGNASPSLGIDEKRRRACEDDRSDGQDMSNQNSQVNLDSNYSYCPLESRVANRTMGEAGDEYIVKEQVLYASPFIDILIMNLETPSKELHTKKEKNHSKKKSKHKKSPKSPQKVSRSAHVQKTLEEPGQWTQRMADGSESLNWCVRSRSKSMSEVNEKSLKKESGLSHIQTRSHDGRRKRTHSSPPTPGVTCSEQKQSWQLSSHLKKDTLNEKDPSRKQTLGYADKELKGSDIKDSARGGTKEGHSPSWHELQSDIGVTNEPTLNLEFVHRNHDDDMEKVEPGSSVKTETWLKNKKYVMKEFTKDNRESQNLFVDQEANLAQGGVRDRQSSASPVSVESLSSSSQDKQKILPPSGPQELCYLLESESSIEATETEDKRHRHPRELSQILKSGSSLEIAKSPQKQLAIINTHEQYEAYFFIPDESNHSAFPPTPGKFFVSSQTCPSTTQTTILPPSTKSSAQNPTKPEESTNISASSPTCLSSTPTNNPVTSTQSSAQNSTKPQGRTFMSAASSSSSESSKSLPAPHGLPPKKRKFMDTELQSSKDTPVSKRRALKALSKMKDLETFLNKVHRP